MKYVVIDAEKRIMDIREMREMRRMRNSSDYYCCGHS